MSHKITCEYHSTYSSEFHYLFDKCREDLDKRGQQMFAQLNEALKHNPVKKVSQIGLLDTGIEIEGTEAWALVAMTCSRKTQPKFMCSFAPKELLLKVKEDNTRILQDRALSGENDVTIAERQIPLL
jgi:hypothetical protein